MTERVRPYQYYDIAVSICSACYRRVDAKIVFQEGCVYMHKRCPEHGSERVLVADDVEYWRRAREVFLKPSEMPRRFQTPVKHGCPYDCGLCTDHEQHSCLTLIEVGDGCNLECPVCYAASGPKRMNWRTLPEIERMLDALVESEGEPDVVQISGGEPTLHPQFFEILEAARRRPIRHLMVNTNGLRIAQDEAFAEKLAGYMPHFEVYLQFDSFERETLLALRGADTRAVHERALERLNRLNVSTTLVVTLAKGRNDHEIGKIVEFALQQRCVRGVTLQPVQDAGRILNFDPAHDRLTLTEVRRRLLEQTSVFQPEDVLPVPCHPDAIAMAYALKLGGKVVPLTGMIEPQVLIEGGRNTIAYERDSGLQAKLFAAFSTAHSPASGVASLRELLCCLPKVVLRDRLGYDNLFRVIILQFLDAHSFDVRSVKKSCVHIVHPRDLRIIPFDTYNLFYRDELEQTRLAPLQAGGRA
ncbi:MAG: radical SAM protein [Planctomycetes bacterium]|nr:radical SAM protein [Planctomycetota bacterium]